MQTPITYQHTALHMDIVVHIKVLSNQSEKMVEHAIQQAFLAFRAVEEACSRFDDKSELRRLMTKINIPVNVSPILFEALRFAWEVAHLTEGVFDPTIGLAMEAHGFNKHYLTGEETNTAVSPIESASYLDIVLNEEHRTVQLNQSMVLDLGAIAKGLAIDLAKKELSAFEGVVIDAGGIAPFAMMADAFSTAAFNLGPEKGINLLNNLQLEGLCITQNLEVYMTPNLAKDYDLNFIKPGGSR